jgi:hypothetical protein
LCKLFKTAWNFLEICHKIIGVLYNLELCLNKQNRRGFLILSGLFGASQSLPALLGRKFGLDTKDTYYVSLFETYFPKAMNHDEYERLKSKYIRSEDLDVLYRSFVERNKIIKSEHHVQERKSQWFVVFDSKASYYLWCYRVVGLGIFDELNMLRSGLTNQNFGFRIPSVIAQNEMSRIIESLASFPRETLHRTKNRDDLGEGHIELLS